MIRNALIALVALGVALVCASAHAAVTGATVGIDDDFWGWSIGQVDNAAQTSQPYGVFTGALDMATVNGWLTTGGIHSFALIAPGPDYLGNASLPLAGVPDTGVQEMTLTLGDSSQATLPLINAAFIKRGIPWPDRESYYQDMDYHNHESPWVWPANDAPRPVLYQVDLSAYQGQSVTSDPVLDLRGIGYSEPSKIFDAYEVTEWYDYTGVTYAWLVYGVPPSPPPPCYDPNCDGVFSDADYTIWADNYGATDATIRMGDMNGDGVVSDADYTVWADHYGEIIGDVPEPVTLAILALGVPALARRRR